MGWKIDIDNAQKEVLVDMVKLAQKKGMQGALGDWKCFLTSHDKQFGAHLSDPRKRSHEILATFLKTLKQADLKIVDAFLRRRSNRVLFEFLCDKSSDTPEQRLVQKTLQHSSYLLDYRFRGLDEEWMVINLKKKNRLLKFSKMVAIDCQMVLCEDGTEAVVDICVVDRDSKVKLKKLVQPNKAIADYRSDITGVHAQDLEGVTRSLAKIQKSLNKMLMDGTILVGHGLHNDLRALKLDYVRVIDTSYIFQHPDVKIIRTPSLNALCKGVLGYEVRKAGAPRNCLDNALAAMKLVLAKIERGVDNEIQLVEEPVLDGPNIPKRASEAAETAVVKKIRMAPEASAICNECDTHLNEIESLKQLLKERDLEIESLKQQLKQIDSEIVTLGAMA